MNQASSRLILLEVFDFFLHSFPHNAAAQLSVRIRFDSQLLSSLIAVLSAKRKVSARHLFKLVFSESA